MAASTSMAATTSMAVSTIQKKTKSGAKTRVQVQKNDIPNSDSSDYSDDDQELYDYTVEEMMARSLYKKFPKKKFRFGDKTKGYTSVLHFFQCQQVSYKNIT